MEIGLFSNKYAYNLFVKIVSLTLSVISGALFTRFLGASLKGDLAGLESISFVASVVMNFGIYHLYPKYKRDAKETVKQKFIDIIFFLTFVYVLVMILFYIILQDIMVFFYGLFAIVACLTAQITMIGMVEIPKQRSKASLLASILHAVLCIFFFFSSFERILIIPLLVYVAQNVFFCLIVLKRLNVFPHIFNTDFKLMMKLIKLGFIPMITALLLKLNYKVDVIMLNIFGVQSSAIGIYAVAISVATQLWIIPEAFKEVLYSNASSKSIEKPYISSMKISTYSLLIIELILLLFGPWILYFLYGEEFNNSYSMLVILMIGVPFMGIFNIVNPYYLSLGKFSIHLKNLAIGVICNIIVNIIVITKYQAFGAAIATSFSQIACGLYACYQFCKSSGTSYKELFVLNRDDLRMIKAKLKL